MLDQPDDATLDGLAQVGFQLQALHVGRVHIAIVEQIVVLARSLGVIHGSVGCL